MSYEESIAAPRLVRWALAGGILLIPVGVVLVVAFNRLTLAGEIAYGASMGVAALLLLLMLRRHAGLRVRVTESAVSFTAGGVTRTIPLAQVVACSVSAPGSAWQDRLVPRFLSLQPRVWDVPGVRRGVLLVVLEGGQRRHYFLASANPEALAAHIARGAGAG